MSAQRPPGAVVYPAAERNKPYILQCLQQYLAPLQGGGTEGGETRLLLEVGAGTGQHVAYFAPNFPQIVFQPTEIDLRLLKSIEAFRTHLKVSNMKKPAILDVTCPPETWLGGSIPHNSLDYVLSINMVHISPWTCAKGLFEGAAYVLKPGGYLLMYGPFAVDGKITPQSNINFDRSLRAENADWGLRDITRELEPMASGLGLRLVNTHDLPANNKFLAWLKQSN